MTAATRRYYLSGVAPILVASILWAVAYFIRKTILVDESPLFITFSTAVLAAIATGFQYRINPREIWKIFYYQPWLYIFLAITGVVLGTTFMFIGLQRIDLGVASLLEKIQPIFILICAAFLLKESITTSQLFYAVIALMAFYVIAVKGIVRPDLGHSDWIGVLAVVAAALSWAFSSVIGKMALNRKVSPENLLFIRFTVASILLLPVVCVTERNHLPVLNLRVVSGIAGTAYFSIVLGYIFFYRGLRHVSATVSGFLELVTPVVATLLGIIFLGETLNPYQILAAPVLLFSIFMLSRRTIPQLDPA
jgi:probable blue pigment (indigoidine) exporter